MKIHISDNTTVEIIGTQAKTGAVMLVRQGTDMEDPKHQKVIRLSMDRPTAAAVMAALRECIK